MAPLLMIVGEVMLDVLGPPVAAGNAHAPVVVRAGGTAVTAALAARAAGARTAVVGRVGADVAAAAVRAALDDAGVETYLAVDRDLPTGTFVELGDTVVAARGANAALRAEDVPQLEADAVFVSGYVLVHDDTLAAGQRALAADSRLRAVGATPLSSDDFVERAAGANVLFANADEAERLGGAARLAAHFEIVCVTLGADGALLHRNETIELVPPSGVTGTGAGDAFAGALLARL